MNEKLSDRLMMFGFITIIFGLALVVVMLLVNLAIWMMGR